MPLGPDDLSSRILDPDKTSLLIAAPASGQGKTTVTLGLLRALKRRGVDVASAKSGPDYIDPAFHTAATGRACLNLDSWAMRQDDLRARAASLPGRLLVVEGAMGLLDGPVGTEAGGRGSAGYLAQTLGAGVVLVVDAARMGQSVGALVQGFVNACPAIAGVVLNRVGSARHADMLRSAIRGVPVLGTLPRAPQLALPSRHLGLVQAAETSDLQAFIDRAADWIETHVDLDQIIALARPLTDAAQGQQSETPSMLTAPGGRIAVARDEAFAFAYTHVLEDWRSQGAEIYPFSPLADEPPDADADAIFLPGGYPELHAGRLARAERFRTGMIAASVGGTTIYGECGGFMVLGQAITDADGQTHPMLGLLRLETSFAQRQLHLGYRRLQPLAGPWRTCLAGHEFHYSSTLKAEGAPLFKAQDAAGTDLGAIGLASGNVSGSFAHVIAARPGRAATD